MKKVLIGNGGHAREVTAQMGVKLERFVDDQYVDYNLCPQCRNHVQKFFSLLCDYFT